MPNGQSVLDLPSDLTPSLTDYVHTFNDTALDSKVTLEDLGQLITVDYYNQSESDSLFPLDSETVKTVAQTLTNAQKAQARDNIGGLGPIYLLGIGQSNDACAGANFGLASHDLETTPFITHFKDRPAGGTGTFVQWDVTADSPSLSHASSPVSSCPTWHLAKRLYRETGREIRVVSMSEGGKNLTWMSAGGLGWARVVDAVDRGGVTKFDYVTVIQGEAEDAGSDTQHNTRLATFVSDLRALTPTAGGDPVIPLTTPIIFSEIDSQYVKSNRRMEAFAELNNSVFFAKGARDLPKIPEIPPNVHLTADARFTLANEVIYPALFKSRTATSGLTSRRATVTTGTQYVTIPSSVYSNMLGSFTFRCRYRPDFETRADASSHGGSGYYIADFGRTTASDSAFGILLAGGTSFHIWVNDNADKLIVAIPEATMDLGETMDIGVTWDSATKALTCYINGVSAGTKLTAAIGTQVTASAARLLGDVVGTRHGEAVMKWAAFWPSVLPTGTMTTISDDIPDLTGALAGYKLNTPPNDRLYDSSGNSRHGTWVGTGAYNRDIS